MNVQHYSIDFLLLCISCGASVLATSIPTVSTLPATNFTNLGAAFNYGTDTSNISKTRRKRYITQNDMLAILDYHNKVRGKVFPPASNMEYMVSDFRPKSLVWVFAIYSDDYVMSLLFLFCVYIALSVSCLFIVKLCIKEIQFKSECYHIGSVLIGVNGCIFAGSNNDKCLLVFWHSQLLSTLELRTTKVDPCRQWVWL